jgi:hypothetical protein
MYVVVRRWRNAATLADAMTSRSQEVEELLRGATSLCFGRWDSA